MSESTQSVTRTKLKEAVGQKLGVSRTVGDWSATTASDVDRIIASGLRSVYSPMIRSKNPNAPLESYVWSFVRKQLSISVTSLTNAFDLPDDFGGVLDRDEYGQQVLGFSESKDWPLIIVEPWRVTEKIQAGTTPPSGITQPLIASIEPKTFTASTGQRWQLRVWPTIASGTLTVVGQYHSIPDLISSDSNYPQGNALNAETILEAVLAAAEEYQNDQSSFHRSRFQQLLEAAIDADRKLHTPVAA